MYALFWNKKYFFSCLKRKVCSLSFSGIYINIFFCLKQLSLMILFLDASLDISLNVELEGDGLCLEVFVEGLPAQVLAEAGPLEAAEGGGHVCLVIPEIYQLYIDIFDSN